MHSYSSASYYSSSLYSSCRHEMEGTLVPPGPKCTPRIDDDVLLQARHVVHEIAILLRDASQSPDWPARCRLQFTQLALYYRNNQHSALALAVDVVLAMRRSPTPYITPRLFWHALSVGIAKNATVVAQRGAHRNIQTLMRDVALQIVCKSQRSELPVADRAMGVIRDSFRPVIVRDSPRVVYQPAQTEPTAANTAIYATDTAAVYTPAGATVDAGNVVQVVKPKKIKPAKIVFPNSGMS